MNLESLMDAYSSARRPQLRVPEHSSSERLFKLGINTLAERRVTRRNERYTGSPPFATVSRDRATFRTETMGKR